MADTISWTLVVQINGGPKLSASKTLSLTGYGKFDFVVPAATAQNTPGTATVDLLSTTASGPDFILITSSVYSDDLTYRVNVQANPEIELDEAHLFMGEGAIGLLDAVPETLIFSNSIWENNQGQAASVRIIVGREAG